MNSKPLKPVEIEQTWPVYERRVPRIRPSAAFKQMPLTVQENVATSPQRTSAFLKRGENKLPRTNCINNNSLLWSSYGLDGSKKKEARYDLVPSVQQDLHRPSSGSTPTRVDGKGMARTGFPGNFPEGLNLQPTNTVRSQSPNLNDVPKNVKSPFPGNYPHGFDVPLTKIIPTSSAQPKSVQSSYPGMFFSCSTAPLTTIKPTAESCFKNMRNTSEIDLNGNDEDEDVLEFDSDSSFSYTSSISSSSTTLTHISFSD